MDQVSPCPQFIDADVWKRAHYYSCTRKTLHHLELAVDRPIALEEMAAIACMERTTFSRTFKRKTGITMREFVRAYRISQAAARMEQSDYSITEIAFSVGFGTLDTFERAFKSVTGSTPTDYRTAIRQKLRLTAAAPLRSSAEANASRKACGLDQ